MPLTSVKIVNPSSVLDLERSLAFLSPDSGLVPGDDLILADMDGRAFATARVSKTRSVVIGSTSMTANGRMVMPGRPMRDVCDEYDQDYADAVCAGGYMDMVDIVAEEQGMADIFDINLPLLAVWWDVASVEKVITTAA